MIVIPNMEKPKSCAECDWIAWSNLQQSDVCDRCDGRPIEDCEKVADFCPLIEIVRCKECKWLGVDDGMPFCNWWLREIEPNVFCSYGERRTNEE